MSRRSGLSRIQSQQRAASRMTVGTRMWSEQPINTPIGRFRVTAPPPPVTPPFSPPSGMTYVDLQADVGGGPTELWMDVLAGDQVILVCSSGFGQPLTIPPGWTVLDTGSFVYVNWTIITRRFTYDQTVKVVTAGPENHPWTRVEAQGWKFQGLSTYGFIPTKIAETYSQTVTMSDWAGDPSAYRMRVQITTRIPPVGGSITPAAESGHTFNDLGYLSGRASWWNRTATYASPADYMQDSFTAGTWLFPRMNLSNLPHWVEYHIELVPA